MKHNLFSRVLSMALVFVMMASVLPTSILADDELVMGGDSAISQIVGDVLSEETPVPAQETPAPAEETPAPAQETPAPAEETPAPAQETPAPAEETPAPAQETPAPAQETPAPAQETPAPAEETPAPAQETPAPAQETPVPEGATVLNEGEVTQDTPPAADGEGEEKLPGVYNGMTAEELIEAFLACGSIQEIEELLAGLTEEEINAFVEEIGEEKAAELEAYFEALLQAEDEAAIIEEPDPEELPEDEYIEHVPEIVEAPQPVVPFTNAVPMFNTVSASAALLSNNMPMLRMARSAAPMAATYSAGESDPVIIEDNGLEMTKTVTDNEDGTYTIDLGVWTEGTVTSSETTKPLDIVLVLDQSGSMSYDFTSVVYEAYTDQTAEDVFEDQYLYSGMNTWEWYRNNTWVQLEDGSYSKVTLNRVAGEPVYSYGSAQGDSNSTLYSKRNTLYYLKNNQYYEVEVSRKKSGGFLISNYSYTYTANGETWTSDGRSTRPDFASNFYYRSTTYEYVYEFTYTDTDGNHTVTLNADDVAQGAFQRKTGLTLYYTKAGGSEPRLDALITAVDSFIDSVAEKAKGADGIAGTDDDVAHRIAIVGFSSEGYKNTELLTGVDVITQDPVNTASSRYYPDEKGHNGPQYYSGDTGGWWEGYKPDSITNSDYKNALQDVSNVNGLANVEAAVDYLTAEGGTQTDAGMNMANWIFAQNPINSEERDRVAIVFTDGIPTGSGNSYNTTVANNAIAYANEAKTTYGADVYAIGIFEGADATDAGSTGWESEDADKGNYFMQRLSSNNGTPQSPSYYLTASNSSELNAVFDSISQTTGSSKLDLDENTVVKDVLTQYFTFPEGFSAEDVEIYTQAYNGTDFVNEFSEETTARASIDSTTGAVSVTNYDFSTHFISENGRDENNPNAAGNYYGEKLIISFTIVPKEEFWGGNQVPTNDVANSGVYEDGITLVENFPEPNPVDVTLKEIELTAQDQNIYYGNTAPTVDDLVNKIEQPTNWCTDYVQTITYEVVEGTVSNIQDGSYTVKATLNPKYPGTKQATGDTATAKVNVFKPVVTWQDTTQDANRAVDNTFADNKVSVTWKHGNTAASSVEMLGTEPTLSFRFAQENGGNLPATLTEELHVKVTSVTANGETNVTSVTAFAWQENGSSVGCSSTCVDPNDDYQFRIHLATGDLVINKTLTGFNSTMGKDATFLFQVKHLETGKIWYRSMTFAKAGSDSLTMEGMPAGHYEVTELDSAGYKLTEGYQETVTTSVTAVEDGQAAFSNEKTGDKTPGDQDYVQNNFEYDKDKEQWVFTQG